MLSFDLGVKFIKTVEILYPYVLRPLDQIKTRCKGRGSKLLNELKNLYLPILEI